MQRQRRLADAAFLIEERDDHGALPAAGGWLSSAVGATSFVNRRPAERESAQGFGDIDFVPCL
jgi:hypothetical protein